jgi:TorA maturation chaperone TorD
MISGNLFEDLQNVLLELGFDSLAKAAEFTKSRQYCASQNTEDLLHELRREYTRLFIKTSKDPEVAIYEALFIAKHKGSGSQPLMFVNPEAIELSAIYKRVGIVRNRDFNYSEDHFAFQFIFLSKLHQILGLVEEHQEDFSQLLEEYHEKHFDRWSVDFFAECEKASLIETYRTFWQLGKDISATLIAEQIAQRKEELVI